MKIAYLCADPGIPVLGSKGASVHVREFTDALVALGHDVRIYSAAGAGEGVPDSQLNATQAPLTVLAPSEQIRRRARIAAGRWAGREPEGSHEHLFSEMVHLLADPEFERRALPLLRAFGPDLIIARHTFLSTAGPDLARALGRPCVLEVNAPLVDERRRYWGLTLRREAEESERAAFHEADLLVAVSEGIRAYLLRYGAPHERILVMPNGVNLTSFNPEVDGSAVRSRFHLDEKLVIGFSGSLKPWHGVDQLLKAFASLRSIPSRSEEGAALPHLLIIGEGPQGEALRQLSRELGLNELVTFTGAIAHGEMPAHLAAMDIAVAPYLSSDGFYFSPLKVMEYLAMGRPVVAPRLGQIPSLLQGGKEPCGLIYPPDDPHQLAAALLSLITDGELRRRLGASAAAQARLRSSWKSIAAQILGRAMQRAHRSQLRGVEVAQ
ncbi:MAG TPA: glycosyltransferase family 4 protein [Anaerolineales bacterium]